jgi:hypothetical protein
MNRAQVRAVWFVLLVFGIAPSLALPLYAETLPVYRLKAPNIDKARGRDLFIRTSGQQPTTEENEQAVIHRSGRKVMEVEKRSGHIFFGDMERLWNPQANPNLPDQGRAKEVADRFLAENRLAPTGDPRVRVAFSHHSATLAGPDVPGQMQNQLLDRQVNYQVAIVVSRPGAAERVVPVYGGGGKFKVAVGEEGSVIGFQGGWREIAGVESEEEILPQSAAEAELRKRFAAQQVTDVTSRLAYYAASASEAQTLLPPVWVVSGRLQIGQESVPIREVVIPATKFGPKQESGPGPGTRAPNETPRPGSLNRDEGPAKKQSSLTGLLSGLGDLLAPPASAQDPFECGTSWIGPSQGLGGSPANRQGFIDHCRAAGWSINFDWGEANAFESDWNANDDSWVDAADLVFYTGHASQDGWVLNQPNDTFLHFSEVGPAGGADIYGSTDVEWIIIAACGPLQSTHFTTNTTNAFDRWRGIFDGLHILLGYGAITFDNTLEGRRFMELARGGWNVVDAWFRTAWEIQPSTNGASAPDGPVVVVAAMYAHNGDHCARNEHLWGMGPTCADVTGTAQQRTIIWSGT